MVQLITMLLIIRIAIWIIPEWKGIVVGIASWVKRRRNRLKNIYIFDNTYIETKAFYLQEFGIAPSRNFIDGLDHRKLYKYVKNGGAGKVMAIYHNIYYNWQQKSQEFSRAIFMLENKILVELGNDYAEVLYDDERADSVKGLINVFATFKACGKIDKYEINIITLSGGELELRELEIKSASLDIGLYYNDDFKIVDEIIIKRLGQENDKGIILLHGLPGTGKTTYLRHLVGKIKKKILFVSPNVAGNLMNPDFIDLLVNYPNSVLIIEDAENIIMDRKLNSGSSVSNLLNISDGLLSDCLNVQIICTFNSALHLVDSALLRKGRLIAKYEFGKLDTAKAQRLSDHLGHTKVIMQPMTLAEIAHSDEMDVALPSVNVVGFRREATMN